MKNIEKLLLEAAIVALLFLVGKYAAIKTELTVTV
jgi:outer membrane murein-binding lipoprotein Lpp